MARINGQPDDPGPSAELPGFDPVGFADPFAPAPVTEGAARFWSTLLVVAIVAGAVLGAALTCWRCAE